MSRGRGSLRARLSDDRWGALCGRCGVELAFIVHMTRQRPDGSPGESVRILRFDPGWKSTERGVWVLPARSQRRLAAGHSPWRRARNGSYFYGAEPSQLPVQAVCSGCQAEQELDPGTLDVAPTGTAAIGMGGPSKNGWRFVPPSGGMREP